MSGGRPQGPAADSSPAVLLSNAVGDSIMMMALVNNLARSGRAPCVIGPLAEQLAAWFPACHVYSGDRAALAGAFDVVVELYPTSAGAALARTGRSLALAELPGFRQPGALMLDNIVDAGCQHFGIADPTRDTGIAPPHPLMRRRFPERVVIHPTASHPEKAWSRPKFARLAEGLRQRGFAPSFIVPPRELDAWRDEEAAGTPVHAFESLAGVAAWIAEAGAFVGNDSGPGHLASALGVPTLSLFMRRGLARTWRPGWAPGAVVLPVNVLPGARLRERFWQRALPVERVLRAFDALQAKVDARAAGPRGATS